MMEFQTCKISVLAKFDNQKWQFSSQRTLGKMGIKIQPSDPLPPLADATENKFRFIGGYFLHLKLRRTISEIFRTPSKTHPEVKKKKIPLRRGLFSAFKVEAYDFGDFSHAL